MTALTRVDTGPMLYAPRRKPQLVAIEHLSDAREQTDEHAGRTFTDAALANLAHELRHSEAEVNALSQAGVLAEPRDLSDPLQRHDQIIGDIDSELGDVRAGLLRLEVVAEQLKAKYRALVAPLIEEMKAQKRRESELCREYERRIVRMTAKRPSRKRT